MTSTTQTVSTYNSKEIVGFGLRIPDLQDALVGPVTGSIGDAARIVAKTFDNGFPNWEMYRTAIAGDTLYTRKLIDWCVAFSVAYCSTGGVKNSVYSDELAVIAGWDAAHIMINCRPIMPYTEAAQILGVHHKTYKRARDQVFSRMKKSLEDYIMEMCSAYFFVLRENRKCGL
jgi:hypothetical protein